jgi:hypothetical protein
MSVDSTSTEYMALRQIVAGVQLVAEVHDYKMYGHLPHDGTSGRGAIARRLQYFKKSARSKCFIR